jgi:hypothetical protein
MMRIDYEGRYRTALDYLGKQFLPFNQDLLLPFQSADLFFEIPDPFFQFAMRQIFKHWIVLRLTPGKKCKLLYDPGKQKDRIRILKSQASFSMDEEPGNVECVPGKGGFMRRLAGLSCHGMNNYDLDFF